MQVKKVGRDMGEFAWSAQGGAEHVRPCGCGADFQPIWPFHRLLIRTANLFRRSTTILSCILELRRGASPAGFAIAGKRPPGHFHRAMGNPHDHPAALKDLQDLICREQVLRARAMTPEERFESVFELSDFQIGMMHAGAMDRLGTLDATERWREVRRWMNCLDRARDFRSCTPNPPLSA